MTVVVVVRVILMAGPYPEPKVQYLQPELAESGIMGRDLSLQVCQASFQYPSLFL
jgi:hypothetical protein